MKLLCRWDLALICRGCWYMWSGSSGPCSQGLLSLWGAVPVPVPPQVTRLCGAAKCRRFGHMYSCAVNCWGRGLKFPPFIQFGWDGWQNGSCVIHPSCGRWSLQLQHLTGCVVNWFSTRNCNGEAASWSKVTPVRLLCRLDVSTKMSRSIAVNEQEGYSFYLVWVEKSVSSPCDPASSSET